MAETTDNPESPTPEPAREATAQPALANESELILKERTENVGKLETIITYGFVPMAKKIVQKTPAAPASSATITSTDTKGFGGYTFDWKKMSGDPFAAISKLFAASDKRAEEDMREAEAEREREEAAEEIPMVIVADFTLPYRCCEHYECEDMCFTETELKNLPIPPFAKDDFVVTRMDTPVDIYPERNDSGLFKDYIVVKEVKEGKTFQSTAGGKVKGVKAGKGKKAHFTYTPPAGKSGISDSFPYTLVNTANGLSDDAIVWIEIAPLPEAKISLEKNLVCFSATPVDIKVDAPMRDPNTLIIEMDGDPESESISYNPTAGTWSLLPSLLSRGQHTLTLKQNGDTLSTYTFTLVKPEADFYAVPESIKLFEGKVSMTLTNTSIDADTFEWHVHEVLVEETFGMEPANIEVPLSLVTKGRLKVTLIARSSAAGCTAVTMSHFILIPQARITLTKDTFCKDEKAEDFTFIVEGYKVEDLEIIGSGAEKMSSTRWRFNPKLADAGDNTLQLVVAATGESLGSPIIVTVIEVVASMAFLGAYRNQPNVTVYLASTSTPAVISGFEWTVTIDTFVMRASGVSPAITFPEFHLERTDYFIDVNLRATVSDPASCGDTADERFDLTPYLFSNQLLYYYDTIKRTLDSPTFKETVLELDASYERGETTISGQELESKLYEAAKLTKDYATDPVKLETLTSGTSEQPIEAATDSLKLLDEIVRSESIPAGTPKEELLDLYKVSLANTNTLLSLSPNTLTAEENTKYTGYIETLETNNVALTAEEVKLLEFSATKSLDPATTSLITKFKTLG